MLRSVAKVVFLLVVSCVVFTGVSVTAQEMPKQFFNFQPASIRGHVGDFTTTLNPNWWRVEGERRHEVMVICCANREVWMSRGHGFIWPNRLMLKADARLDLFPTLEDAYLFNDSIRIEMGDGPFPLVARERYKGGEYYKIQYGAGFRYIPSSQKSFVNIYVAVKQEIFRKFISFLHSYLLDEDFDWREYLVKVQEAELEMLLGISEPETSLTKEEYSNLKFQLPLFHQTRATLLMYYTKQELLNLSDCELEYLQNYIKNIAEVLYQLYEGEEVRFSKTWKKESCPETGKIFLPIFPFTGNVPEKNEVVQYGDNQYLLINTEFLP